MISVTVAVPENKLEFFKELVKSLNFKEIDIPADITEIPEAHQKMVQERIKNSKPENWLRWNDVQDSFKLD
jgi:hypothetical protein